jgi:hypothetical protein
MTTNKYSNSFIKQRWILGYPFLIACCIFMVAIFFLLTNSLSAKDKSERKYDVVYLKIVKGKDFTELVKLQKLNIEELIPELVAEIFALADIEENRLEKLKGNNVGNYTPNLAGAYIATITCRNAKSKDHMTSIIRLDKDRKIVGLSSQTNLSTDKLENYLSNLILAALKGE